MNTDISIPQTTEEAASITSARGAVIVGGIAGLFVIGSWAPWLWLIIGAILVPVVWVQTGRKLRATMALVGCQTKDEWKTFKAGLPSSKNVPSSRKQSVPKKRQNSDFQSVNTLAGLPPFVISRASGFNYEVAGEAFRRDEIVAALGFRPDINDEHTGEVDLVLVPEPNNPYDPNAVAVWLNGHHVGYMERPDAPKFQNVVSQIAQNGYAPTVKGRIWATTRIRQDGSPVLNARISLSLPEPHFFAPATAPITTPHSILPWGVAVQVTKEKDHLEAIAKYLAQDQSSRGLATLHYFERERPKSEPAQLVEVRLDNTRVGELTAASSKHYFPVINHLQLSGLLTAAWVTIQGSRDDPAITLHAKKANELGARWTGSAPQAEIPKKRKPSFEEIQDTEDFDWTKNEPLS